MQLTVYAVTLDTPCGHFSVAVNDSGAVIATAFGNLARLHDRLPDDCHMLHDELALTKHIALQVNAYFAGKLRAFSIPIVAQGTFFQKKVWMALATIPFGETRSYGHLATVIGNPRASRAIGRANATNPVCLLVPCHRVIGADGSLTGFAFGERFYSTDHSAFNAVGFSGFN